MKSCVISPRRHAVPAPKGVPRITSEERSIRAADARVILHRAIARDFPQVKILGLHGEDGLRIGVPEDDPGLLERLKAKLDLVSGPPPGPVPGEPVLRDIEPTAAAVAEAHAAGDYRPTVVGLLRDREGNFLLLQSRHDASAWMFLQGGIEPGESPAAALVREAHEELGIDGSRISGLNPLGVWDLDVEEGRVDTRGFTKGKRYFAYEVAYRGPKPLKLQAEELADHVWIKPIFGEPELLGRLRGMRKEKASLLLAILVRALAG